jgi:hypothetical protein
MFVPFERTGIPEAITADAAYIGLGRLLEGALLSQVTRRANEIGCSVRSERGAAVLALHGMNQANHRKVLPREGTFDVLGLHSDGWVDANTVMFRDHETVKMSLDELIRMIENQGEVMQSLHLTSIFFALNFLKNHPYKTY